MATHRFVTSFAALTLFVLVLVGGLAVPAAPPGRRYPRCASILRRPRLRGVRTMVW